MRPAAILFDFGDTLANEGSELKDPFGATISADLIPGAEELLRRLHDDGYRLAIVADSVPGTGRRSYESVLRQHGLTDLIDAIATSDEAGAEKPDPAVFRLALDRLGIDPTDYGRVVMVGNRVDRDVAGANRLGLVSVWLRWSPRYHPDLRPPENRPRFTIDRPLELLDVLERLE